MAAQCDDMLQQGDSVSAAGNVRRSSPEVFKHKTFDSQVAFMSGLARTLDRRRLLGASAQAYRLIRELQKMPESVAIVYWKRKFSEGGLNLSMPFDKVLLDEILLEQCPSWYSADPEAMRAMRKSQKSQDKNIFQLKVKLEELEAASNSVATRTKARRRGKVPSAKKTAGTGAADGSSDSGSGTDGE